MNNREILKRIISIIEDSNLTNSEFAEKIGVPKSTISHLLSERNNPSLDIVSKISSSFDDITSDYLIFGQSKQENNSPELPRNLFSEKDIDFPQDSVKEPNNKVKSIIIIYENNKFEQIDKV
jgi:transcriptional regulator with XRE-family HTH domain|tara:strand:- start:987 stop:1352 length:366 start_codon:yes stop_codon:yes gene_type:complete